MNDDWKGAHLISAKATRANGLSLAGRIRAERERRDGINKGKTNNHWARLIRSSVIEAVKGAKHDREE